jgi:hypothetical protein
MASLKILIDIKLKAMPLKIYDMPMGLRKDIIAKAYRSLNDKNRYPYKSWKYDYQFDNYANRKPYSPIKVSDLCLEDYLNLKKSEEIAHIFELGIKNKKKKK